MADSPNATPQSLPLMDLPVEVVYKILTDYQYVDKDLRAIRLVCRQMNDSVKHVALHHLKLIRIRPGTLEQMASKKNTFDEVTKVLTIGKPPIGTLREKLRIQGAICRVIKKLANVHTVCWDMSKGTLPPSDGMPCVYEAVSSMPSLERLVLRQYGGPGNCEGTESRNLGQKFTGSKLRSISVECASGPLPKVLTDDLSTLLAAQPSLEELNMWNYSGTSTFDFAAIVGETPLNAGFQPSLQTLHGDNLRIGASPNVIKYLANLTSLCISNVHPGHDTLWPAFHQSDVKKTLTIQKPTERLTDYLLGYRGLRKLAIVNITCTCRDVSAKVRDQTKHRFLEEGLQHHSNTLCELEIRCLTRASAEVWGLGQRQLAWLESFPKLEKLAVSLLRDNGSAAPEDATISVEDTLNGLFTRLSPTLRSAELVYAVNSESSHEFTWRGSDYKVIQCVRNFQFAAQPRNSSEAQLYLFDAVWLICYDQRKGKYHFKPKFTAGE